MNRIIKLTVALVLALSGFLVAGGSVSGAQAAQHRAASTPTLGDVAARASDRTAVMKFKQTGPVKFKMWVKVTPAGGRKPAKLQRAKTKNGHYRTVRKDKMNAKGVAKFGKISKVGWYRVSVPKTKNYTRTLSSNIVHIYKN